MIEMDADLGRCECDECREAAAAALVELDGAARRAVAVIGDTGILHMASTFQGLKDPARRAPWEERRRELMERGAALAFALVRYLLRTPDAPSSGDLVRLAAGMAERNRRAGFPRIPSTPRDLQVGLVVSRPFLQEAGLETAGVLPRPVETRGGGFGFRMVPQTDAAAYTILEDAVLGRLDAWTATAEAAVRHEVEAARAYFDRWRADGGGEEEDDARAARLRGEEWALLDRPTAAWGESAAARAVAAGAHAAWPARQRRLLELLRDSVAGLFTLAEADEEGWRAVAVEDGREYAVVPPFAEAEPDDLVVGRLVPLGDGRFFASPGVVTVTPDDAEVREAVLRTAAGLAHLLPRAVAAEGALAREIDGTPAPRPWRLLLTPNEAADLLHFFRQTRLDGGAGPRLDLAFIADPVMREWMHALTEAAAKRIPRRRLEAKRKKAKARKR
ncbi:MAG TPA: hypothetical protein VHG91_16395 [Longimicrobium sp.]|nr:hypothetical protein [Longimicrobium sp.]